jgi:hypothetical protein
MNNPITNAALIKAAEAVLFDLRDRKGVGNEIEQCDDDIQAEIGRTVAAKAIHAFLRTLHENGLTATAEGNLPWLADYVLAAAKEKRE